ncbi:alpha/beta hydrolase [Flavobacterium gelatinilyticum]|uniref:alpha/beta hydrolase n=1 Tax=Flavobacterium gelatinilyticum TaxID=3003260 RepID=UPI0024811EEE|nr:alpha/beta hydrolase [Flavobacterium gelatinilyticum]
MKDFRFWILVTATSIFSLKVSAQAKQDDCTVQLEGLKKINQWTLVYENAITENVPGKVNVHPVTCKLHNIDIAANVYTPPNYDPSKKYAAIVVAHPNGGIKEQVAGSYAQQLAELGYITIAADASYQGASGGFPRNVDRPSNRIEDGYRFKLK